MTGSTPPLQLTVDTTVLRSRLKPREADHQSAIILLSFRDSGLCEIHVTTRVDADIPDEPLRSQIAALPVADSPVGSVFRIGVSKLDSGDMIAGPEMVKLTDDLMALLFPQSKPSHRKHSSNLRDVDHLAAHKFAGRNVFVTGDGDILRGRKELKAQHGIRVMDLGEILRHLEGAAGEGTA